MKPELINLILDENLELEITGYFIKGESDEIYDRNGEPGTVGTPDIFEIENIEIVKGSLLDVFSYFAGYTDINYDLELRCIDKINNK